jgi:hypothetical protein
MRRGQMEIMGLVVIVVLFVFGGLIYLTFASKPPDNSMAETRESGDVANLLNSLMKLTPCDSTTDSLDEIIKNCYISSGASDYCENPSCKDYIGSTVLNATKAYRQGTNYTFIIKDYTSVPFISQGSCSLPKKMSTDSKILVGNKRLIVYLIACLQ